VCSVRRSMLALGGCGLCGLLRGRSRCKAVVGCLRMRMKRGRGWVGRCLLGCRRCRCPWCDVVWWVGLVALRAGHREVETNAETVTVDHRELISNCLVEVLVLWQGTG